jgi:hypothetical protein
MTINCKFLFVLIGYTDTLHQSKFDYFNSKSKEVVVNLLCEAERALSINFTSKKTKKYEKKQSISRNNKIE